MRIATTLMVGGLLVGSTLAAGPISELYTIGILSSNPVYNVIQGQSVVRSWDAFNTDSALAVADTVRGYGANPGTFGGEYELDGTPTGTVYSNLDAGYFLDGASSGQNNFGVDVNTGAVMQFSSAWTNPTQLFDLGNDDWSGITYDTTTDTLWLGSYNSNKIANYALDGTLISEFSVTEGVSGLALDPADGTLWILPIFSFSGQLYQYSTAGDLLSSPQVPQLFGWLSSGAEFSVPEPASLTLIGLALALIRRR